MMTSEQLYDIVSNLTKNPQRVQNTVLEALPHSNSRYYHFLHNLAQTLGTSLGYWVVLGVNEATCCAHIMEGHKNIDMVAIDQTHNSKAQEHADKYKFSYRIHGSHDPKTTEYFQDHHNSIGVVFFDTTHIDWVVLGEWQRVKPYLGKRAVLIFDDVHAAEDSVMRAVNQIPGKYIAADHLHPTLGFGVKVL